MRSSLFVVSSLFLLLAACAAGPAVTADAAGNFDTVRGAAGGNEFTALTPEGQRYFKNDAAAKPGTSTASAAGAAPAMPVAAAPATAMPVPAAPVPAMPVAAAPAVAATVPAAAAALPNPAFAQTRILIDANAFAAVFGPPAGPVTPTAAQLMQLDSLSLVAAESLRVDLQTKILACRRAGDSCRLGAQ